MLSLLPTTLSRLGRESEMLDTIITMMGEQRYAADSSHGGPRHEVISRLATQGFELAAAIRAAFGENAETGSEASDSRVRFRESQRLFTSAAGRLDDLPSDAAIAYRGMTLRPEEVVPQRIAEVVLANEAVSSLWSLDEADPDSVRDALDALVRRLESLDGVPGLSLSTIEGDRWSLHGGGRQVHGTREFLASWLAFGEVDPELGLPDLPHWS